MPRKEGNRGTRCKGFFKKVGATPLMVVVEGVRSGKGGECFSVWRPERAQRPSGATGTEEVG